MDCIYPEARDGSQGHRVYCWCHRRASTSCLYAQSYCTRIAYSRLDEGNLLIAMTPLGDDTLMACPDLLFSTRGQDVCARARVTVKSLILTMIPLLG